MATTPQRVRESAAVRPSRSTEISRSNTRRVDPKPSQPNITASTTKTLALDVLKTTSYAASFSDRPAILLPIAAPVPKPTEKDVSQDVHGVFKLTEAGNWQAALLLVDQVITQMKSTALPHVLIQLSHLKIVISFKLKLFKTVSDEFSKLGDLNGFAYYFETYPSSYPSLSGSFIPFSLRILQAELPWYQGNWSMAIDSLYNLLDQCKKNIFEDSEIAEAHILSIEQVDSFLAGPIPLPQYLTPIEQKWNQDPSLFVADISSWRSRFNSVTLQLISYFTQSKEYPSALSLLQGLIDRYPNDVALLSATARLFIQIGLLPKVEELLLRIEATENISCTPEQYQYITKMNRACLHSAKGDYKEACTLFSEILEKHPHDMSAVNNKAVCLVYTCQLTKAVHLLEDFIAADPFRNISEAVVQNLLLLYDVHTNAGAEKKEHLMTLVRTYANNNFDHSALKRI